jgi:hypothetical protein
LDLRAQDASRLFRDQGAVIDAFAAAEGEYRVVLRPQHGVEVRLDDLLIRREERDRFEREQQPAPRSPPSSCRRQREAIAGKVAKRTITTNPAAHSSIICCHHC